MEYLHGSDWYLPKVSTSRLERLSSLPEPLTTQGRVKKRMVKNSLIKNLFFKIISP